MKRVHRLNSLNRSGDARRASELGQPAENFTHWPLGATTERGQRIGLCPRCGRHGEVALGREAPSGRALPTLVTHTVHRVGPQMVTVDYCVLTSPQTRAHLSGGPELRLTHLSAVGNSPTAPPNAPPTHARPLPVVSDPLRWPSPADMLATLDRLAEERGES